MMLEFGIASDLYEAGRQEDGVPFIAEQYYILATDETGRRWRHDAVFNGCSVSRDDEGFERFTDIRTGAVARATMLLNRILASNGAINFECWSETYPVYGSDAYQMDPVDLGDAEYY
jgi:hypothetical protein